MKSKKNNTALQAERLRQSLSVVPIRNAGVEQLPTDVEGAILLKVKLVYSNISSVLRHIFALPREKTYLLEGIGREVYEDIDGRTNFGELIDRFAERHRLTFLESRALLGQYYQLLAKRGLIVSALSDAFSKGTRA